MTSAQRVAFAHQARIKPRRERTHFNKYDANNIMAQLRETLLKFGLEDTWEELRRMGAPQLVEEAWRNRESM